MSEVNYAGAHHLVLHRHYFFSIGRRGSPVL
jgi:hypothetical protein